MKAVFRTRFAVALTLFVLANAGAMVAGFCRHAPEDFPFLSWTGWTIKSFLDQPKRPDVVFLGSSLMLVPLDGTDADYLNRRVDGSQHHHSAFFEHAIKSASGLAPTSFTFALPGEMPSDAYLITTNLLKGERHPDLIIYGVGPRDFLDNLLPSPAATDPYHYLSRFADIGPIANRVFTTFDERFGFELSRAFYFYGQRESIVADLGKSVTRALDKVLPLPAGTTAFDYDDRHQVIPDYHPCQVAVGQAMFRPVPLGQPQPFVDNLGEYRKRYAKLKWDTYTTQMGFLADTLEAARKQGSKCVVVAMPLTQDNISLLSNDSWNAYVNGVASTAQAKGASFIDMSKDAEFSKDDFNDTVHLHSGGGRKFLSKLASQLADNQEVLTALAGSRPPVATQPQTAPEKTQIAGKGGQL